MALTAPTKGKPPTQAKTVAVPSKAKTPVKAAAKKSGNWFGFGAYLADIPYLPDRVPNPQADLQRRQKLLQLIRWQALAVTVQTRSVYFA
ncbi:MAG: hypothetical protein EBV03_12310, partial [Proteobacteria bacterium]|nr:hypothetical protein [Pseudomonadota bacterium]